MPSHILFHLTLHCNPFSHCHLLYKIHGIQSVAGSDSETCQSTKLHHLVRRLTVQRLPDFPSKSGYRPAPGTQVFTKLKISLFSPLRSHSFIDFVGALWLIKNKSNFVCARLEYQSLSTEVLKLYLC